jgi:hypothetical protein
MLSRRLIAPLRFKDLPQLDKSATLVRARRQVRLARIRVRFIVFFPEAIITPLLRRGKGNLSAGGKSGKELDKILAISFGAEELHRGEIIRVE